MQIFWPQLYMLLVQIFCHKYKVLIIIPCPRYIRNTPVHPLWQYVLNDHQLKYNVFVVLHKLHLLPSPFFIIFPGAYKNHHNTCWKAVFCATSGSRLQRRRVALKYLQGAINTVSSQNQMCISFIQVNVRPDKCNIYWSYFVMFLYFKINYNQNVRLCSNEEASSAVPLSCSLLCFHHR